MSKWLDNGFVCLLLWAMVGFIIPVTILLLLGVFGILDTGLRPGPMDNPGPYKL